MRLVDRMARSGDLGHLAVSPLVIPFLEIGIDDLVRQSHHSPSGLPSPSRGGHRRAKNLCRGKNLRVRFEHGLRVRQVGSKEFGEVSWVEIGEAISGLLNGALCFGKYTGRFLTQGAFVFSDIRSVRGNIDEADDMRINAGLGDDGAAVTMADKDAWSGLKIEDTLRRRGVRLKGSFRFLHHGHVVAILGQDVVNGSPAGAVNPSAVH